MSGHAAELLAAAQDAQLLDPSQDVDAMVALTVELLARANTAQGIASELKQLRSALQLEPITLAHLDEASREVHSPLPDSL